MRPANKARPEQCEFPECGKPPVTVLGTGL